MARKEKDGRRVDEVIEKALQLFLERGYDNAPLSALANELGLTKAAIYHHFESKEELLFVVHQTAMERQLAPIYDAISHQSDPAERLRQFIFSYARMLAEEPTAALLVREARRLSPAHLAEIKKTWRRGFELIRQCIQELQDSGRCRGDVDPTYAAFGAIGMASWISYWFDPSRPDGAEAVAKTMSDIFMTGLAVRET